MKKLQLKPGIMTTSLLTLIQARGREPTLTYLLLDTDQHIDLSNLERWYTRDQGERIGRYMLYRLTPRDRK